MVLAKIVAEFIETGNGVVSVIPRSYVCSSSSISQIVVRILRKLNVTFTDKPSTTDYDERYVRPVPTPENAKADFDPYYFMVKNLTVNNTVVIGYRFLGECAPSSITSTHKNK